MIASRVELTKGRAVRVFWSYVWRAWLLATGFQLFGYAHAFVGKTLVGGEPTSAGAIYLAFGTIVYVAVFLGYVFCHVLVFRIALRREWSDFKLVPVSKDNEVVELTLWRSFKVQWSFGWRAMLLFGALVLLIAVGVGVGATLFGVTFATKGYWAMALLAVLFLLTPLILFVQALVLRIALRVKWSDFELIPVTLESR